MINRDLKNNQKNYQEKQDFSGFVIDLRLGNNRKTNPGLIKSQKLLIFKKLFSFNKINDRGGEFDRDMKAKISKTEKELKSINKRIKELSPNLLAITKTSYDTRDSLVTFKNSLLNFNFKKYFKKTSRKITKKNSYWLKNYQAKLNYFEDILDESAKSLKKKFKKRFVFKEKKSTAEIKLAWYRSIFSFVLVLIFIVVPFKILAYFQFFDLDKLENKILNSSKLAFSNLMAAGDAVGHMDLQGAELEFKKAADNFLEAEAELDKIGDSILTLSSLANNPKFKLAAESKKFIKAGVIFSSFGRNLVLSTDSLFNENQANFAVKLDQFVFYGQLAVKDARDLEKTISDVDLNNLPEEYRAKFKELREQLSSVASGLESFINSAGKLKNILGVSHDKRYLLVFQNNSELRASGGFLGSYALIDIREGKIRNLEIPGGGSYDTEGAMNIRMIAPRPLWLVNTLWHFWDANWWPNWPTTARNLMWFYEKSGGPTVDGVISITPDVIEDLLRITGPIDLQAEYGLVIDADNFWENVQKIVEHKNLSASYPEEFKDIKISSTSLISTLPINQSLEVNAENKPKKIIGDLTIKILEILPDKLNKNNLVKILELFEKNLSAKQILFYFNDESLQAEFSSRNWAGEIKDTDGDYLLVVNTNIAGQKSDKKMREEIKHLSEVEANGSIINTVTITRTHTGFKNEPLSGVRNVNWLRIYVPLNSELISAEGFIIPDEEYLQARPDINWQQHELLVNENEAIIEDFSKTAIYQENGKTVFANWLMVDPGQSQTITIKYRLPFNLLERESGSGFLSKMNYLLNKENSSLRPYSLLIQKQAGAQPSKLSSRLKLLPTEQITWSYPLDISGDGGWFINDSLDADKYWSILIKQN